MNLDTLETINGPNGSAVDETGYEDPEAAWREMRGVVDEIERNYSLEEIPEDD